MNYENTRAVTGVAAMAFILGVGAVVTLAPTAQERAAPKGAKPPQICPELQGMELEDATLYDDRVKSKYFTLVCRYHK